MALILNEFKGSGSLRVWAFKIAFVTTLFQCKIKANNFVVFQRSFGLPAANKQITWQHKVECAVDPTSTELVPFC